MVLCSCTALACVEAALQDLQDMLVTVCIIGLEECRYALSTQRDNDNGV